MKGLGSDIIEVERIEASIQRYGDRFLERLFTTAEQAYCNRFRDAARHYAGRFAAKEAIAKALGTGFGDQLSWLDIEILNDEQGKPIPHLREGILKGTLELSISHCKAYALAVAIIH